jgi:hypothetical protein
MSLVRNAVYHGLDLDFDEAIEDETAASLLSHMWGCANTGMRRAMQGDRKQGPRRPISIATVRSGQAGRCPRAGKSTIAMSLHVVE